MAVNPLLLPVEVSGRYWEETQGCGGFFTGFRRTSGASSVAPPFSESSQYSSG